MKNVFILFTVLFLVSCSNGSKGTAQIVDTEAVDGRVEAGKNLENDVKIKPAKRCSKIEKIVNGSFEEGHDLSVRKGWDVYDHLPGWELDLEESDAPFELQWKTVGGLKAKKGKVKLELDSHPKDGFTESDAAIYQDVPTKEGGVYHLRFFYSPRTKKASSNQVEVYWNDEKVLTIGSEQVGWKKFKLKLRGVDGFSRLKFKAIKDNDTVGAFLDGVSLKEKVCTK